MKQITNNEIVNYINIQPKTKQLIRVNDDIINLIDIPTKIDSLAATFNINSLDLTISKPFTTILLDIASGCQSLLIPPLIFHNDNLEPQYGEYIISIKPKYIPIVVSNIIVEEGQTKIYFDPLELNQEPWFYNNITTISSQNYRLSGSLIEIYNNTENIMKGTQRVLKNNLTNSIEDNYIIISSVNYPEQIILGDVLHIYPLETYFEPIFIEVLYNNTQTNTALEYLLNDAVRNLENGRVDVYDENGVTISPSGELIGEIKQSFQLTQVGNLEIRKRIAV